MTIKDILRWNNLPESYVLQTEMSRLPVRILAPASPPMGNAIIATLTAMGGLCTVEAQNLSKSAGPTGSRSTG